MTKSEDTLDKEHFLSKSSKKVYILQNSLKKEVRIMEQTTLATDLLRFQSDFMFFQNEVGKFRKQYLNKFIAVFNDKIIDSASSIEELKDKLQQKGIDMATTVVEFVSEEEHFMVL